MKFDDESIAVSSVTDYLNFRDYVSTEHRIQCNEQSSGKCAIRLQIFCNERYVILVPLQTAIGVKCARTLLTIYSDDLL